MVLLAGDSPLKKTVSLCKLLLTLCGGFYSLNDLDALVASAPVGEGVFFPAAVILDVGALDMHAKRTLTEVGIATSPVTGTLGKAGVATGPDSQREAARCLRVPLAILGIGRQKGTHEVPIDHPLQPVLCPVDCVVVKIVLDRGAWDDDLLAVCEIITALAKVVGESHGVVDAEEFQVNLVQVVAQQHDGADDTPAGRGLHYDLDATKKQVLLRADGRGLALLGDCEGCAVLVIICNGPNSHVPGGLRLVEDEVVGHSEGRVRGAVLFHGVAVGVHLSDSVAKEAGRREQRNGR